MSEVTFTDEQQALVSRLVGEARTKAATKAKTEYEAAALAAKDNAEKAALEANKEWQALAEKHAARVTELEPLQAQAQAYNALVSTMLKDRVKALGDAAKKAVGGLPDGLSDLDKLNWLNSNESLFQATGDGVGTPGRSGKRPDKEKPGRLSNFSLRL